MWIIFISNISWVSITFEIQAKKFCGWRNSLIRIVAVPWQGSSLALVILSFYFSIHKKLKYGNCEKNTIFSIPRIPWVTELKENHKLKVLRIIRRHSPRQLTNKHLLCQPTFLPSFLLVRKIISQHWVNFRNSTSHFTNVHTNHIL